ncbi:leucyl aminopeptidase [Luethyella okanaganae]|uniref:Probable cytosol aminopeptidase n=1 Tax=Luethyella okanaganae TaxID=69372 RepID=A0ABW1VCK8_9MICO
MTSPTLSVSTSPAIDSDADVVVVGALSTDGDVTLHADAAYSELGGQLAAFGVTGARDQLVRIPAVIGRAKSIAIVGLGPEASAEALRYAAGTAVRRLTGVDTVAIALPLTGAEQAAAVLEGAAIGGYAFTEYRHTTKEKTKIPAGAVTVHSASEVERPIIDRAVAVAEAIGLVKDLVNTPPSDLFPASFADRAVAVAADLPLEIRIWDEEQLAAGAFGGILGVGQGSSRPPRLVKVSYSPADASKHLALVGKGITFDSGGLSLKPPASMVGMKYDMTGAATVLAVALAAARLALPVRVTAWLCLAENMPSGTAIRPNDVLRIRGGQTVEVLNTDAEGRLVLADGLVAASEEHPDAIVDVATLTGAAVVALGNRYTGVMGDDELVAQVLESAKAVDESFWAMPLPGELRATIDSDVADIANAKIGSSAGGMLLAGVFLREFVGTRQDDETPIPWAHLDIAGPSNNEGSAFGFTGAGPTGVSVRALIRLAEEYGRP